MPLHHLPSTSEQIAQSPLLPIGLGAALLIAGRRLFWLFIGAIGFFAAMRLASQILGEAYHDWVLIGSLVAGVLGAMLAIFVQKAVVSLGGAIAGAYLLDLFFRSSLTTYPAYGWLFLIGAAVLGALLMAMVFEWALIFLSSLAGAQLISQTAPLPPRWIGGVSLLLLVLGILIQSRRRRPPPE